MRIVRRLFLTALLVGAFYLAFQFITSNSQTVPVHYVFGTLPEVPLWSVILASFGTGAVLAGLLSLYELAKQGFVARRYRKTAEGLESEIHQMRNLPLVTEDEAATAAAPPSERSA